MKHLIHNISRYLLAPEGDSSGGGNGSPLFTASQGGGPLPTPPTNPDPAPGANPPAPAGNPPANSNAGGNAPADWKSSLPKELQEDVNLSKFTSPEALARSYISAQKLIGVDKIPMPTKHTTDEQWQEIYRKLGVPEKLEEYQVKFKEGAEIDAEFTAQFRDIAHKSGLLPKQAQALAEWMSEQNIQADQQMQQTMKQSFEKNIGELKTKWGNAFDLNLARANKVIQEVGGTEVSEHFRKMGLGGDTKTLEFMAKLGEVLYKEHKFVEGQGGSGTLNPQELDKEITRLMSEPAYFDKTHPKNKIMVQEVMALFEQKAKLTSK